MNQIILDLSKNLAQVKTKYQSGEKTQLKEANRNRFLFSLSMTTDIPDNVCWIMLDFDHDSVSYRFQEDDKALVHLQQKAGIKNRYQEFWSILNYQKIDIQDIIRMADALLNGDMDEFSVQRARKIYLNSQSR